MSNSLDRESLRQEIRDANYAGRKTAPSVLLWIGAVITVFAVIGAVIWGVKVATSDVKGAGDAVRQVNSANNRLQAQAKYASLYEGIQAADRNIDVLAEAAKTDPTVVNKTNLVGAQNVCNQSVADYNAMATNTLTSKYIPEGLPVRIGDDPASDCKPTAIQPTP